MLKSLKFGLFITITCLASDAFALSQTEQTAFEKTGNVIICRGDSLINTSSERVNLALVELHGLIAGSANSQNSDDLAKLDSPVQLSVGDLKATWKHRSNNKVYREICVRVAIGN